MKKYLIDKHIYLFEFGDSNSRFGSNITVLIQNNSALLIDVAYAKYAIKLRNHLFQNGINNFTILLSHHHADHFEGCKCFSSSTTYASNLFLSDPQCHLQSDSFLKNFKPDKWLTENLCISFGSFKIKCFYTPGHNRCGFSFIISDKILHAGDLFFGNTKGLPSIPYLDESSTISEYIYSLEKIKNLYFETLIQGHGKFIVGRQHIQKEIDSRLHYLNKLRKLNGNITLTDCVLGDFNLYSGSEFHSKNCFRAKYNM